MGSGDVNYFRHKKRERHLPFGIHLSGREEKGAAETKAAVNVCCVHDADSI